ncbi:MFS transporter [Porphyromonas sp. COT-239 OH1446]|uniref:MFS transporter n=1 Tax=Porphyromonas sp. COT-239 OH1446 TaxID=1515613 RepID=UPI00052D8CB1|nr:MFS transporter [Porphyromonas sp. COT-239 OH1446]KGN71321.1 MFS transporter [Porphyromonas sp. COT-239 OH1446]
MRNNKYYPWVVVGLLWVVALLNYMDRQMLSTMKSAMSVDIKELESGEMFGVLMAAFMWIYGLASPFAGLIADRINRKWLIVASLFVWSTVTLLMGYTHDFSTLYALRMVMGFSEAMYIPAALALIADFHSGRSRSLAIGVHMTGLYVGQALGGFGALLSEQLSWQNTFFYFGLFGTLYAFVLIFLLHEVPGREGRQGSSARAQSSLGGMFASFGRIFSSLPFWGMLLFFTATSLPGWATKNWLPTLFEQNLGIEMTLAGPISTATIALSCFIGVFVGGSISDRWAQVNVKGRVYTSAIGLGMMIPALLLLGFGHSYVTVVGGGFLFGFGLGFFDTNNMPILCQFFPSRYRSTAYGLMNMSGVIAGGYITQALGKSQDTNNLGSDFATMAVAIAIVVIIQLLLLRPQTDNMTD